MARTRNIGLMLLAACMAGPAAAAEGIAWRDDFEAAKREAATTGRLVLLHFSGTFCPPCRSMEQNVFNRADVAQVVEQNYVPVAVDVEKNSVLKQQFGIRPIPADVIVTPEGQVINKSIGAKSAQEYMAALSHYARLARKTTGDHQAAWPSQTPTQPNPLAPRVGQQHPNETMLRNETMLQPPPVPDAGNTGAMGAGSTLFGPPANRGTGSAAPPWRQQDSPQQPGPGAYSAVPRGPSANSQVTPPWATPTPSAPGAPPTWPPSRPSQGTPPPSPPPAQPPQPSFGGYCAVTMYHEGRWLAGDRRWGVIHEGRLYLFANEQAKEAFRRDFNRYAPVFGGDDIVIFVETNQRVPGQVRIGAKQGEQDPRTYLFATEQSYQKFYANPAFYIERLRQMTGGAAGR